MMMIKNNLTELPNIFSKVLCTSYTTKGSNCVWLLMKGILHLACSGKKKKIWIKIVQYLELP